MQQAPGIIRHDALQHLQRGRITRFSKGELIYDSTSAPPHLYLVVSGRVQVFHTAPGGQNVLLGIIDPEGFFGDTAIWSTLPIEQTAVATLNSEVMVWSAEEIHAQVMREPALGLALIEELCARCASSRERIFALSLLPIRQRLIVVLLQLGEGTENGTVRLKGLTHQLIADYAGTSREIVTMELNRLRRRAAIGYARTYLDLYRDALAEEVRAEGIESFCAFAPSAKRLAVA